MGMEIEVNTLEDMCDLMCDNKLPRRKPMKNTKYLFDESQSPEGMISVSQLQTYLSCRKKWEYNYIENLTPKVERSYLTIGKLCHKGMQTTMYGLWKFPYIDVNDLLKEALSSMDYMWVEYMDSVPMLDEEIPDMDQTLMDAKSVFVQAFREFEPWKYEVISVVKDGREIPALELHFKVPCPPTKGLHGYIDAILRDKETGFVWCTDYKFRKSLSPDDEEAYNIQNAVYSYACRKMGIDITGTMTWQHVNTPAADPQLLKNGSVSRAKIKTTWEHYAAFCIMNKINPVDYQEEMQEKLADVEWFRPTYEYRNEETIDRIWEQCVRPVASALNKSRGKNACNFRSLYPWNCKMCQYQSICQAELRDYDAEAIRQREYVKREHTPNTSPLPSVESESE
jgi:hypothetical protein